MPKSIETIYKEFSKKYMLKNCYLASGGLADVKGPGTSDVDIVFIVEKYNDLENIFKGAKKEPRPDKKRCYYHMKIGGREVSVCATNDKAALRSVVHRNNEIALNKYPMITACAIWHKMNGKKTEDAWATVLGFEGDPYEVMARDKKILLKRAAEVEKKISKIYSGLSMK